MSVQPVRRRFNVEEYYRMGSAAILPEDSSVELVEGDIIERWPVGSRHAACVGRLTRLLGQQSDDHAIVWIQNPVQINDYSEPVPDVTLLRWRDDFYAHAKPVPEDVLLLVEVSDTTLNYDRKVKLPLYARGGVPEVWLVNLPEELVEVYARPADGSYQETRLVRRGESVTASAVDGLTVEAAAVLG